MKRALLLSVLAVALSLPLSANAAEREDLQAQLNAAKPGATIKLPAGTFSIANLSVPSGVTLMGAGSGKTVLSAGGAASGLLLENVSNVVVKNLTVRMANGSNIQISGAQNVKIEAVIVQGSKIGVTAKDSKNVTIQNVVSVGNRLGVGFSKTAGAALINSTIADSSLAALSVSGSSTGVCFNNIFWQGPIGVLLDSGDRGFKLDYNLYWTSNTGRIEGTVSRVSLSGWQTISHGDQHSVQFNVQFKDLANLDLTPVSSFDWRPFMAVTANWGVDQLDGVKAPLTDIAGQPRKAEFDLGAYQSARGSGRPADGVFTVTQEAGVKSAGVYTQDGINIANLFQNLPLKPDKYPFWVPSRDWQGRPIPPGNYEVRLVQSNLSNTYIAPAGNFAKTSNIADSLSWPEEVIAFDAKDRVIAAQNSFENGTGVRAFDATYDQRRWLVPGGGDTIGGAVDQGLFYYVQKLAGPKPSYNLRKLDVETGEYQPFSENRFNLRFANFSPDVFGLAAAHGKLFIADAGQNKIFIASANDPKFESGFDVPAPSCVSYDSKSGLLWVISNQEKLLALNPDSGEVVATVSPASSPNRMNVNNGRLAYLSRQSGKIHVLDVSNPKAVAPIREIGRGDGPYGKLVPDRFLFQTDSEGKEFGPTVHKQNVSINSKGDVAIIDGWRVLFWGADGKLIRQGMGIWGQHITIGKVAGDDRTHLWSVDGTYDIALDAKARTWEPGTRWKLPNYKYPGRSPSGFFNKDGRNFGLHAVMVKADPASPKPTMAVAVIEFTGPIGVARTLYLSKPAVGLIMKHDDNGDGIIDENDTDVPVLAADGKPLPQIPFGRYNFEMDPDGSLNFASCRGPLALGLIVPFGGFDEKGNPVYNWTSARALNATLPQGGDKMISPYDFKTEEIPNTLVRQIAPLSDGGFAQSFILKSAGGTGLQNGAGTDLAGFDKDGRLRWFFPLSYTVGSQGVQTIPQKGLVFSMWSESCDYLAMDEDGLGLGSLSMTEESHWGGMWSDHAQQQRAFLGNDGKPYYVLGDYAMNCYHWFAIEGADNVKHSKTKFALSEKTAKDLATLPLPQVALKKWPAVPRTEVLVKKLAAPLPVDGDPNTWGKTLAPTAIITPEIASGDINGAQDCSATIRLAYLGEDLYVQTIVFDDHALFHQPADLMYRQDGIEMTINGYMEGFKFNVGKTSDLGDVVLRNRFARKLDRFFDNTAVPRVVKILDNAETVADRKLIEDATGKDLSQCQAIVTQFKLPLNTAVGWEGDIQGLPEVRSGSSFCIGFYINDNDRAGGDVQDFIPWPASYSLFTKKESGAIATFE